MKSKNSKKKTEVGLFDRNSFAARFKKMRLDRQLKQSEFAEVLFTSTPSISRLEQGVATPDAEIILRIAEEYECDIYWLLTGQRDKASGSEAEVVKCDSNICNLLRVQREGLQEIADKVSEGKGDKSQSFKMIRDKIAYIDALLRVGENSE